MLFFLQDFSENEAILQLWVQFATLLFFSQSKKVTENFLSAASQDL